MATVEFKDVGKTFPGGTAAVADFNLSVADGEFVVLVGPSGCGKSTLLRLLAGLEEATAGEIRIGDRRVNELPPQQRDIAMVFQNYALYPHMTVQRNLSFPLRMTGWPRDRTEARVAEVARLLELEPLLQRKPAQLSGGQRQRVAMGRALVREPAVFLLDEPLSNLDAQLRVQLRREITALQRRLKTTTLYVTHDQVEAMTMGDRLAVLHAGRLQQAGTPNELYARPANLFVATFLGSPRMNLFATRLTPRPEGGPGFEFGGIALPMPEPVARALRGANAGKAEAITVGVRPEGIGLAESGAAGHPFEARVVATEALGHEQIVHCDAGVRMLETATGGEKEAARAGSFAVRLPASVRVEVGDRLKLAADFSQAHYFDAAGEALRNGAG